jgi:hypothetical protein
MSQPQLPFSTPAVPQLFAGNYYGVSGQTAIGQFGSATTTPAYTTNPTTIQGSAYAGGWASAVIGSNQPALEDMNSLFYLFSYFLTYLSQRGIPEWDSSGNTYYGYNAIVNNSNIANGPLGIYVSQAGTSSNNTGLLTNPSAWLPLGTSIQGDNVCKAWVTFDGTTNIGGYCNILNCSSSINSSTGVQYVGQGNYIINFNTGTFTQGNYAFSGSAGTQNGNYSVGGDNNVITGGTTGKTGLRTTSQLEIFCWESNGGSGSGLLENSSCISVLVFGR